MREDPCIKSPVLYLQHQYELLQVEYEYEKEQFKQQTELMGIERKIKRGMCWYPLNLGRNYYNALNQLVIEVERREDKDIEHQFPDAELKIFVTASAAIRAQRRYDELRSKGQEASYEKILENVEERDRIDQTREVGPLRQADDAILLDNSHMSIAEQKEWLTEKFQAAING